MKPSECHRCAYFKTATCYNSPTWTTCIKGQKRWKILRQREKEKKEKKTI